MKNWLQSLTTITLTLALAHVCYPVIEEEKIKEEKSEKGAGLKKFLGDIDPDKEPEKYDIALKQFASTITNRIAVLQQIKQKKSLGEKKVNENIEQAPMTQTLAYLNPKHDDNFDYSTAIQKTLDDYKDMSFFEKQTLDPEYLTKTINNIICTEQSYADNYYVLYTALTGQNPIGKEPGPSLLFDIYAEIIQWLAITPEAKNVVLRLLSPSEEYTNVTDFLDKTKEYLPETFDSERTNYDHIPKMKKFLISTNLSLFGNQEEVMECTLYFWLKSHSVGAPSTKKSLNDLFEKFGFTNNKIDDIIQNYNSYYQDSGGNLLQIFIDKKIINNFAYLSLQYGMPLYYKNVFFEVFDNLKIKYTEEWGKTYTKLEEDGIITDPFSKNKSLSITLEKYINDKNFYTYGPVTTSDFPWFDQLQARLLWVPSIFYDESKVKIFRYYAKKQVDEKAYKQKLNTIFKEIMQDWIVRRLKAKESLVNKDLQGQNLDNLLECLINAKESVINPIGKSKKTKLPEIEE